MDFDDDGALALGFLGSSGGGRSPGCSSFGRKLLSDAQASSNVPSTVKRSAESSPCARACTTRRREASVSAFC